MVSKLSVKSMSIIIRLVRNMMLQRGIVPEDLPAGEDVKKVERRLKSDEKTLTKKNSKKK